MSDKLSEKSEQITPVDNKGQWSATSKTSLCNHKGSCMQSAFKGIYKGAAIGLAIHFVIKLLGSLKAPHRLIKNL